MGLDTEDYELARQRFIELVHLNQGSAGKSNLRTYLIALAAVAAGTGFPERAARLFGAAQAILDAIDPRPSIRDQAEFDRYIQIAQERIGESAFQELAAEGRTMTAEQALQLAMNQI